MDATEIYFAERRERSERIWCTPLARGLGPTYVETAVQGSPFVEKLCAQPFASVFAFSINEVKSRLEAPHEQLIVER